MITIIINIIQQQRIYQSISFLRDPNETHPARTLTMKILATKTYVQRNEILQNQTTTDNILYSRYGKMKLNSTYFYGSRYLSILVTMGTLSEENRYESHQDISISMSMPMPTVNFNYLINYGPYTFIDGSISIIISLNYLLLINDNAIMWLLAMNEEKLQERNRDRVG